jgi:hypothetical protein
VPPARWSQSQSGLSGGLVIAAVVKATAEPRRKYQEWKKTVTPGQLTAVRMGEAAAAMIAAHEVHNHVNSPEAKPVGSTFRIRSCTSASEPVVDVMPDGLAGCGSRMASKPWGRRWPPLPPADAL